MNGTTEPARIAIGYTRVSVLEQAREGLSLPAQGRAIRAYARAHAQAVCARRGSAGASVSG